MRVIVKPTPFQPSQVFTLDGTRLGFVDTIDLRAVEFPKKGEMVGHVVHSYGLCLDGDPPIDLRELGISQFKGLVSQPRVERHLFRDYVWDSKTGTVLEADRAVVSMGKILLGGEIRRQQ